MNTTTVSPKYQIVIPKALREKLGIRPGQTVYLAATKKGDITVSTSSRVEGLYGSMAGAWKGQGDQHIAELRAEANHDRA